MKKVTLVFLLILSSLYLAQAQSVKELYQQGIKLHDSGSYKEAIKKYKKALKKAPESASLFYEISMSYLEMKEYKKCIKYADKVLKQENELHTQAYMTKSTALDYMGKTEKAIKLLEKAIKVEKPNYLLHYNLALDYSKMNDLANTELHVIKAIELNGNHASSHFLLARISNFRGSSVKTLLSSYYFLFLEADSKRSPIAYELLRSSFKMNVEKDKEKENQINISIGGEDEDGLAGAELMLAIFEAGRHTEEQKKLGLTDEETMKNSTKTLFGLLLKKDEDKKEIKNIWLDFYAPFFEDVAKSEHFDTFYYFTTMSGSETAKKWVEENVQKLDALGDWLKAQY